MACVFNNHVSVRVFLLTEVSFRESKYLLTLILITVSQTSY